MANRQEYLDYLCHHGTKGQKWGKRNYQYEDGTGTPEGLKRRREEYQKEHSNDEENNAEAKDNKSKNNKDPDKATKRIVDSSQDLTRYADKAVDIFGPKAKRRQNLDLSNMTDAELRDRVNRARLELDYNNMFNPVVENRGKQKVKEVLAGAGAVFGIAGSALAIAVAIKQLRSK